MLQRWVLYTLFIEHLLLCSCHNSPPPIFQSGPTIFTYVIKDCAHQCARQSVQRKQLLLFISSHITATAVYSESFLEESLIFFCLRSASPSVYEYHQLCSTCISSAQDHLQIPHLPSGTTPGLGRTWRETATHLLSRPRRWQKGTIVMRAGLHTTFWRFKWKTLETAFPLQVRKTFCL